MENIPTILSGIAEKKNITILYACETGSRAWGFPSPDSDYDIRFIYVQERDWYLSLNKRKDTIEYMDGELDITGWDLRKSLNLLKKSNAALIERFQSPIEYYTAPGFKNDFKQLLAQYYSPTAVFYHHYSLAKKFWEDIKDKEEIKLKSYCYLVRSLLSCNWIIRDKSVLPMDIEGLMTLTSEQNRTMLRDLIKLKSGVGEKYLHPNNADLKEIVTGLLTFTEANKENLGVSKADFTALNDFFIQTVHTYAHL